MSFLLPVSGVADDGSDAGLAEVGIFPQSREGFEHGLVVLAMGHPYWLVPSSAGYRLLVEPDIYERAREEIARFDHENVEWPPEPIAVATRSGGGILTPLLWAIVIFAVFHLQGERPHLTTAAALDPTAIFDRGEWWRLGTALFIHADVGHVISNALGGILIFAAMVKTLGALKGWLLLAAASLAGNLVVAALHYPTPYESLGASTAIFAGVGLLTGRALGSFWRTETPDRRRALFVALASGLTVLGLYGAGSVQIDVGAHLGGFLAGLVLGYGAAVLARAKGRAP